MINYLLLLNSHRNLSSKRKSDYKRSLIIALMLGFAVGLPVSLVLDKASKEDIESLAIFVFPMIIILDFSLRFFLKSNASAPVFPYLSLPIPRKALLLYIVLSDLLRFWVWGCWLIYCAILLFCGTLTFSSAIIVLLCILLNNYLIAFVKALIGKYVLLTYPFCFAFVIFVLLLTNLLNPVFAVIFTAGIAFSLAAALYFTLKEYLYKELNRFAI